MFVDNLLKEVLCPVVSPYKCKRLLLFPHSIYFKEILFLDAIKKLHKKKYLAITCYFYIEMIIVSIKTFSPSIFNNSY